MAEDAKPRPAMKPQKKKRFRFHADSMEPTDAEFNELFDQYNNKTAWFVLMFILAALPRFCVAFDKTGLLATTNVQTYCVFPDLLNNNWTIMMTNNLTMPKHGRICTYHMFDFEEIKGMTFIEAIEMKKNMEQLPPIGLCAVPLNHSTFPWNIPNFLRSCASKFYWDGATTFLQVGEAISYVVMGIVGDLYGRKFGMYVFYPIYAAGLILQPLTQHYYMLCAALFCKGFGSVGLMQLSYVHILELCNPVSRGMFSLLIMAFSIFGHLCSYFATRYIQPFSIAAILCSLPSLSLLLYLVYVPESPRWQLSYGMKRKAWATLDNIGVNTSGQVYLPRIKLSKGRLLYDNLQLLFLTRKYRKSMLIMSFAVFGAIKIYNNKLEYMRVGKLKVSSHAIITITGEIFSFLNIIPVFIIFGRYISIISMYAFTLACIVVAMFFNDTKNIVIINYLTAVTICSMKYILQLYLCELIPTCTRATAFGITFFFSHIISVLFYFFGYLLSFDYSLKNTNYILIVICVCCLVLLAFLPQVYVHQLPDYKRSRGVVEV